MRTLLVISSGCALMAVAAAAAWGFRGALRDESVAPPLESTEREALHSGQPVSSAALLALQSRLNRLQLSHDQLRAEWHDAREPREGEGEDEGDVSESAGAGLTDAARQDERDREQTTAMLDALDAQLAERDPDPLWSKAQADKIRATLDSAGRGVGKLLAARCAGGLCRVELEHTDRASSELFAATAGTLPPFVGSPGFHTMEPTPEGLVRTLYYAARPGMRLPAPE
jgi:hypothetical protein